ncbi:MAG: type VI secretion system tip protein VgrG [Crocinitomicaceae bacterium]|nr:type VI secretion system tip protein VgrG [Crocinitomicaceae bacterium]
MNNSGIIQTPKNPDLITFTVFINGEELSGILDIHSITVSKEVNRIPTASVIIGDGEASAQDFEVSNQDILIPGNSIKITAGYHSDEEIIFEGIIIKHCVKVRANSSFLYIECKDEIVKSTIGRKSKYYYESSDSEIFEEILDNYNTEYDVEATSYEHEELVQYNSSDWDFIVSRAQANGKLCFSDDGKLSIKSPNLNQAAVETIVFGSSMLEFDGEIDSRNQFSTVTSYSWNNADQEIIEIEATDPAVELNGNLSSENLSNVVGLDNLELRHGGNLNDLELQNWADATLLYQQLSKVRGRVKFEGIPTVKPDTIIKLEGVGNRFNGLAYVTGVLHTICEGQWTVDAQFGLSPKWFSETYDISTCPASGLLPAIKGLHIGIVSQLQDDPEGAERTLVKIPIINGEEQGIWCRTASLDAGNNRGSIFRPEIGDEVIIGFINEDPNDAVVLGMLHSSANPSPIPASDNNHEKGFVTRSEIKFIFDDDKKSVTIETPNGNILTLNDDSGDIKIEDENSNVVTLSSNGIDLESNKDITIKATGDVNIEGTNINLKANAEFKAEGMAGAEVSTNAIAVLKGSLVQIN